MTQIEPTSFQVKSYAKYMFDHYGLIPKNKYKSILIRMVAFFLNLFRIMDGQQYMKRYSTVFNGRVYLPFIVGDPTTKGLVAQVAIIAHECEHAYWKKQRGFAYSWNYLFNPARRAMAEVEAYRVNMELHYWYTGKLLSPMKLADKLYSYGCKKLDVDMACIAFRGLASIIAEGTIGADASKHAIAYFNEIMPEYKGQGRMISPDYYNDPKANIIDGVFQRTE
jgi:hypothetical protein